MRSRPNVDVKVMSRGSAPSCPRSRQVMTALPLSSICSRVTSCRAIRRSLIYLSLCATPDQWPFGPLHLICICHLCRCFDVTCKSHMWIIMPVKRRYGSFQGGRLIDPPLLHLAHCWRYVSTPYAFLLQKTFSKGPACSIHTT